jgi:hypothetical protein
MKRINKWGRRHLLVCARTMPRRAVWVRLSPNARDVEVAALKADRDRLWRGVAFAFRVDFTQAVTLDQ